MKPETAARMRGLLASLQQTKADLMNGVSYPADDRVALEELIGRWWDDARQIAADLPPAESQPEKTALSLRREDGALMALVCPDCRGELEEVWWDEIEARSGCVEVQAGIARMPWGSSKGYDSETAEGSKRLHCRKCMDEYAIPKDVSIEFD